MHKKTVINHQTFFCEFSKILTKTLVVHLLCLTESKPKQEERQKIGGFSSKTKNALFQGSKIVLFKKFGIGLLKSYLTFG